MKSNEIKRSFESLDMKKIIRDKPTIFKIGRITCWMLSKQSGRIKKKPRTKFVTNYLMNMLNRGR